MNVTQLAVLELIKKKKVAKEATPAKYSRSRKTLPAEVSRKTEGRLVEADSDTEKPDVSISIRTALCSILNRSISQLCIHINLYIFL